MLGDCRATTKAARLNQVVANALIGGDYVDQYSTFDREELRSFLSRSRYVHTELLFGCKRNCKEDLNVAKTRPDH